MLKTLIKFLDDFVVGPLLLMAIWLFKKLLISDVKASSTMKIERK